MSHKLLFYAARCAGWKDLFCSLNPRPYGTWLQHFALRAFLTTGSGCSLPAPATIIIQATPWSLNLLHNNK